MAVENWINNGEPNLGILITVNNKRENRIYPNFLQSNSGIYQPFLLVFDGTRGNSPFTCKRSRPCERKDARSKVHLNDVLIKPDASHYQTICIHKLIKLFHFDGLLTYPYGLIYLYSA